MIYKQLGDKAKFRWTIFHVVLGALSTLSPFFLIAWIYFIMARGISVALSQIIKGSAYHLSVLFFYVMSLELLGRMAKTYPFVPYESSKYLLMVFALIGLVLSPRKSVGIIMMSLLLIPALFYDMSGQVDRGDLIFNLMAPISLSFSMAFMVKQRVSWEQLHHLLRLIWLGCLAALVYTFIRTPDFETIQFSLKAQYSTTGDHSSNQVSTIFGLGMFLSIYSVINRLRFSGYYWLDIVFFLFFGFQGLLTFSRGGMLVAVLAIAVVLFFYFTGRGMARKGKLILISVMVIIGGVMVFSVVDEITGGMLTLRYQGETEGTLVGSKEKTFDVYVSNRGSIFIGDIELWLENPMAGVGAGASKYLRGAMGGLAPPHIEFSRLLAEHGILGLIYYLLFIGVFLVAYVKRKTGASKAIFLALFILALLTTYHAAFRTFISSV